MDCQIMKREELWYTAFLDLRGIKLSLKTQFWDFPGGSVVKNLPASAGYTSSIPDLGGSHLLQSD